MKWRKTKLSRTQETFQSPARGPETTPVSMTSMQANGCLRFGDCFLAWALANLNISLASARDSNLSVLSRLRIHGLLRSRISRAHRRAALINSSGGTMASTSPREWASCPLIGFDVCLHMYNRQQESEKGIYVCPQCIYYTTCWKT